MNTCEAAELALLDQVHVRAGGLDEARRKIAASIARGGTPAPQGNLGQQIASVEHADWPPFMGCAALFWQTRVSIASTNGLIPALLSPAAAARR